MSVGRSKAWTALNSKTAKPRAFRRTPVPARCAPTGYVGKPRKNGDIRDESLSPP